MSADGDVMDELRTEFPDFKVVPKSGSRLMRAIGWFLKAVTFGKQKTFMESFVTTVGRTIYVPSTWDAMSEAQRAVLLRHERVHLRQQERHGRLLFSFLYLFVFFPMFLAWFRARYEMEAYAESAKADAELKGVAHVTNPAYREWMVGQFVTGAYGWMWPWRATVGKWVDKAIADAVAERAAVEKKQ